MICLFKLLFLLAFNIIIYLWIEIINSQVQILKKFKAMRSMSLARRFLIFLKLKEGKNWRDRVRNVNLRIRPKSLAADKVCKRNRGRKTRLWLLWVLPKMRQTKIKVLAQTLPKIIKVWQKWDKCLRNQMLKLLKLRIRQNNWINWNAW